MTHVTSGQATAELPDLTGRAVGRRSPTAAAEASVRIGWPGGPVEDRSAVRRDDVAVHTAAHAALGLGPGDA